MSFYVSDTTAFVVCFCLCCRTEYLQNKKCLALCVLLPASWSLLLSPLPPSLTFCLPPQIAAVWSKSTQVLRYLPFSHALIPAQGNQYGGQLHSSTMLTINHPLVCQTHGDSAVEETCSLPLLFSPTLSPHSLIPLLRLSLYLWTASENVFLLFCHALPHSNPHLCFCLSLCNFSLIDFSFKQLKLHFNYISFFTFVAYLNFSSGLSLVFYLLRLLSRSLNPTRQVLMTCLLHGHTSVAEICSTLIIGPTDI